MSDFKEAFDLKEAKQDHVALNCTSQPILAHPARRNKYLIEGFDDAAKLKRYVDLRASIADYLKQDIEHKQSFPYYTLAAAMEGACFSGFEYVATGSNKPDTMLQGGKGMMFHKSLADCKRHLGQDMTVWVFPDCARTHNVPINVRKQLKIAHKEAPKTKLHALLAGLERNYGPPEKFTWHQIMTNWTADRKSLEAWLNMDEAVRVVTPAPWLWWCLSVRDQARVLRAHLTNRTLGIKSTSGETRMRRNGHTRWGDLCKNVDPNRPTYGASEVAITMFDQDALEHAAG